ncbi:sulfurtransferase complex subunit TusB [Colwellia sp. 20A7]|uniref:sulfurtransferase complex subunit TusB n=1 Tax=Colwellia sp. 20A7 TaxID=2689569 RepID=UPI00135B92DE|nr:sulfurtransferase complex subunit TusB [Colwellia sp. 20A7]
MTTLHIVRQSAFTTNDYSQCLQVLGDNDVIVFIDDGCYNLHHHLTDNLIDNLIDNSNNNLTDNIENPINIKLNVIAQHANARAIKINEAVFTQIEMADLVSLTFENDRVITWQ